MTPPPNAFEELRKALARMAETSERAAVALVETEKAIEILRQAQEEFENVIAEADELEQETRETAEGYS